MSARRDMKSIARLGGKALVSKPAPVEPCPCCGRTFKTWLGYIGHKGMRATAEKFFNGDVTAAARQLAYNALARSEAGASWDNGAWSRRFRPITPAARITRLQDDLDYANLQAEFGVSEGIRAAALKTIEIIETELKELRG